MSDHDVDRAPTVSVVMPTYNRRTMLERSVSSVLAQTYPDWELIVVDDGSTDDTDDMLKGLDDRRVRAITVEHGGVARARNHAVRSARGEWIAFLDDDNEWHPVYLERQLTYAANVRDAGVVYCLVEVQDDEPDEIRSRETAVPLLPEWRPEGDVFDDLLRGWWTPISGTFMRRDILGPVGDFSTELVIAEDIDLMMRLALRTTFACNADVLVVRHEHRGQVTRSIEHRPEAFRALHHRWRSSIVARRGVRAYLRWTGMQKLTLIRSEIEWLYAWDRRERRAAAGASMARLVRLLPWSVVAVGRAIAVVLLGAKTEERLRGLLRRARRARFGPLAPGR